VKVNSFLAMPRGSSPEPGTYNPEKCNRRAQKQYSFSKAKKSTIAEAALLSLAPGPGAYKVETSLSENRQLLSIHPKAGTPKIMEPKIDSKKPALRYPPLCKPSFMQTTRRPLRRERYWTSAQLGEEPSLVTACVTTASNQ
jgi:hypothetical protein